MFFFSLNFSIMCFFYSHFFLPMTRFFFYIRFFFYFYWCFSVNDAISSQLKGKKEKNSHYFSFVSIFLSRLIYSDTILIFIVLCYFMYLLLRLINILYHFSSSLFFPRLMLFPSSLCAVSVSLRPINSSHFPFFSCLFLLLYCFVNTRDGFYFYCFFPSNVVSLV